jgi:hypothetical protein
MLVVAGDLTEVQRHVVGAVLDVEDVFQLALRPVFGLVEHVVFGVA